MRKYKISFDKESEGLPIVDSYGQKTGETKPFDKVEREVLQDILNYRANSSANLKDFNLCLDLHKQLDESVDYIELDDNDLTNLREGFKISVQKGRPMHWNRCSNLFSQLENPEEIK